MYTEPLSDIEIEKLKHKIVGEIKQNLRDGNRCNTEFLYFLRNGKTMYRDLSIYIVIPLIVFLVVMTVDIAAE